MHDDFNNLIGIVHAVVIDHLDIVVYTVNNWKSLIIEFPIQVVAASANLPLAALGIAAYLVKATQTHRQAP